MVAAFALAIGAAAGRLGFDSLLQRDGPDAVRGRAFARFETRFQVTWVIGGMFGLIPVAESIGLFVLAGVLGFAAVSYVGALRAASKRGMRTKLLPDSVHRELHRSRSQALSKVRGRFRKSTPASGDPPGEFPAPSERRPTGLRVSVEVDAGEPEAGRVELVRCRQHRLALPEPVEPLEPAALDDAVDECLPLVVVRALELQPEQPLDEALRLAALDAVPLHRLVDAVVGRDQPSTDRRRRRGRRSPRSPT